MTKTLVESGGLEPPTSCMPCKRSSQLSYDPILEGPSTDSGSFDSFFSRPCPSWVWFTMSESSTFAKVRDESNGAPGRI